ncbi:MAG: thioredoxin [candidate division KSB1 bacterium]|nr:thioredoxin [candidate division KSB1 bacterium]MDZ7317855.1 thioredoxin [candidate division KSB1 bacterium]MDZ7340349.1 thioredoxin [candidate division KSB1 bacterium]
MKKKLPKSFTQLIQQSELPVVVDFWAEWCGPCKMVSPSLERIAQEFSGQLLVVKINVDEKPHIAAQYQIQSIPTIMMFKNGRSIMRVVGAQPYEALKRQIQSALS